jgi:hypothetical protein
LSREEIHKSARYIDFGDTEYSITNSEDLQLLKDTKFLFRHVSIDADIETTIPCFVVSLRLTHRTGDFLKRMSCYIRHLSVCWDSLDFDCSWIKSWSQLETLTFSDFRNVLHADELPRNLDRINIHLDEWTENVNWFQQLPLEKTIFTCKDVGGHAESDMVLMKLPTQTKHIILQDCALWYAEDVLVTELPNVETIICKNCQIEELDDINQILPEYAVIAEEHISVVDNLCSFVAHDRRRAMSNLGEQLLREFCNQNQR